MPLSPHDKDYRLPASIRPTRYQAELRLDLERKTFEGSETIDLSLDRPASEIVLHGVNLEVAKASCRAGGREQGSLAVEPVAESGTLVFRFSEPIPAGGATLAVRWTGAFCAGLRGLYQSGDLAVTQFEAADARQVFPCFDEPSFKAPWTLTLDVPKGVAVLANSLPAEETDGGARRRIRFNETPPLATYLVALACGKLAATPETQVRGAPVRTWAVPDKVKLATFGQAVAAEVLPRLEDYFGLPYAFGKLDQVAVPDFEAGAMENAGLITYREILLLVDPDTASLAQKKRVAEVITHELAHQWFGNWVTMSWWDDLWLNEAFATWMAFKIVDGWRPDWRLWLEFDAAKASALQLDALRSTHPIRAEVKNAAEAGESFDAITYEKGGAVLRMIESYLGEAPFREGIRAYMRRHAKGNAVANDLWSALAESSRQPVVELANAWIGQAGYPVVKVERTGAQLHLSQSRFFSAPGEDQDPASGRWPVPMVLRYRDAAGVKDHRFLLNGESADLKLPAEGEVAWVCANAGATGFYRVNYDRAGVDGLAGQLPALAPAERVGFVSDEWALVRAGNRAISDFLDLGTKFKAEEDYAVLDELGGRLGSIEYRLVSDADRPRFQAAVAKRFGPQLAAVGWDPRPQEADGTRLRRASVLRILGLTAREPAVVAEAEARVERLLAGDSSVLEPNLYDAAVTMAARGGDLKRFERYLRRYQTEADPAFKRRFLWGLAAFEAAAPAERAQELAFTEVPLQDLSSFINLLLSNRTTRETFWKKLRDRWDELAARLSGAPMLFRRVIEAMGNLTERRHLTEVEAFLAAHPIDAAAQATAQTLERLRQDVALRERTLEPISKWLDQQEGSR